MSASYKDGLGNDPIPADGTTDRASTSDGADAALDRVFAGDAVDGSLLADRSLDTSTDLADGPLITETGGDSPPERGPSAVPDYLIIAADELAASAGRYRDFRKASGFNVDLALVGQIVGTASDATVASSRIISHVRERYQARDASRPMYLLILGDAQPTWPGDRKGVPAGAWQDPATSSTVDSDNVYADMDGDDIPDLAVARITADSDAEVDLVRGKVATYETTREIGPWDRRLNIFASTSGLGDVVDPIIESLVYDITESIPYAYDVTMTYARQKSPYVYAPEQFSDQVYRRINEGALLVTYVGHGHTTGFAQLSWNESSYPILDENHLDRIAVTHKSPILIFIACATGNFVQEDSISERILAQANAPTAILSSTEISDPYANAAFIYEVSQAFTSARAPTVGAAFVDAKRALLNNNDSLRQEIDGLAQLIGITASSRDALKHSHLHMYTLFGDPAMTVAYPSDGMQVAASPSIITGGTALSVTATFAPLGSEAEAVVSFESQRKTILGPLADVPEDDDPERDSVIIKNYQTANNKVVVSATLPVTGSSLSATLQTPAALPPGSYYVKVFVRDAKNDLVASTPITVR